MRFPGIKSTMQTNKRPVFLNLTQIHLPLTGFISIAHRVTGVLLFLSLPLLIYLFQCSLESPEKFAEVQQWLHSWAWRTFLALVLWWFAHHLLGGLRFMLIDLDIGVGLAEARMSAKLVSFGSVTVLIISAVLAL